MADPKVTLEVDLRDKLTAKLTRINKEIKTRGGPAMVKLAKETRRAELNLKRLGGTTGKTNKIFTRFTNGIAIGNLMAIGAAKAFGLLGDGISEMGEAVKVAARIEVLNGVMRFTGKAAGYTAEQLSKNNRELRTQGIAQKEALSLQQRFIQANLDIGMATDIATVAQNAAVIAGVNSSEAALGLTDAIVKQRPILLKQYGIITSLDDIYNKAAKSLGKKRSELTATEKRMGFYNEIMAQSTRIAGAYDTAMDFAGKRLTSLPRLFEDVQQAVGRHFLPAFNAAITVTGNLAKTITSVFGDSTDLALMQLEKLKGATEKYVQSSDKVLEMAERYDILQAQITRTDTEQAELNVLLEDLAKLQPGIVTGWDNMGVALGLNTNALRDAIGVQREFNLLADKGAIETLGDAFAKNTHNIKLVNKALDQTNFLLGGAVEGSQFYEGLTQAVTDLGSRLLVLNREQDELTTGLREKFPDLVEDTDEWLILLTLVSEEFAQLGLTSTIAAEAEQNQAKEAIRTWNKLKSAVRDYTDEEVAATHEAEEEAIAAMDLRLRKWTTINAAALADEEEFLDQSEDGWDEWLRQHDFRIQTELANWKEAQREKERLERVHQETLADINLVQFEASLVGLNEHLAAKMEAERAHHEWLIVLKEDAKLSDIEYAQAKRDSEIILQDDLRQIQLDATNEITQQYAEKWALATDATEEVFGNLARIVVTDTKLIGREMKTVFENVGRSIVVNLAQRGVKAIGKYIFALAAAKTAEKLFGTEQKNTIATTILQTGAASGLATATIGVAAASGAAATAMVAESLVVRTLTKHYIALAAAKNAASLGVTTGLSIAAAATTKAALVPMLLTGFDDRRNDISAFRHGADYGQLFKQGLDSELGSPGFGKHVRGSLPGLQPRGGDGAAVGDVVININIEGSVTTENDLAEVVIDALTDREGLDGNLNLSGSLTGGRA